MLGPGFEKAAQLGERVSEPSRFAPYDRGKAGRFAYVLTPRETNVSKPAPGLRKQRNLENA